MNFVGGWIGEACAQAAEVNQTLMRRGSAFKRPMLWLYGEGDPYYAVAHSRANFDAFVASGGSGEFLRYDAPSGRDGHSIYLEPALWRAALDRYLGQVAPP